MPSPTFLKLAVISASDLNCLTQKIGQARDNKSKFSKSGSVTDRRKDPNFSYELNSRVGHSFYELWIVVEILSWNQIKAFWWLSSVILLNSTFALHHTWLFVSLMTLCHVYLLPGLGPVITASLSVGWSLVWSEGGYTWALSYFALTSDRAQSTDNSQPIKSQG